MEAAWRFLSHFVQSRPIFYLSYLVTLTRIKNYLNVKKSLSFWLLKCPQPPVAETWRRVWGDGEIFRGPRFLNGVFSEKIFHFHGQNFWWPFLLVIHKVFRSFPFFSQVFRLFYYVQCRIWSIPHTNNHYFGKEFLYDTFFYSVRAFPRIRQHYFSKYWGTNAWAVPHLKFLGETSPQSPLGFRPCIQEINNNVCEILSSTIKDGDELAETLHRLTSCNTCITTPPAGYSAFISPM